jgi:hypothetical protein
MNVLVDMKPIGVSIQAQTSGCQLSINHWDNQQSDWMLSHLLIYDQELTDKEMETLSKYLTNELKGTHSRSTCQQDQDLVRPEIIFFIAFNWGVNGKPHRLLHTAFTVTYLGYIAPQKTGMYTLFLSADDEVSMIWTDSGIPCVMEKQKGREAHEWHQCHHPFVAGQFYPHYKHSGHDAYLHLHWESLENNIVNEQIPETCFRTTPLSK